MYSLIRSSSIQLDLRVGSVPSSPSPASHFDSPATVASPTLTSTKPRATTLGEIIRFCIDEPELIFRGEEPEAVKVDGHGMEPGASEDEGDDTVRPGGPSDLKDERWLEGGLIGKGAPRSAKGGGVMGRGFFEPPEA